MRHGRIRAGIAPRARAFCYTAHRRSITTPTMNHRSRTAQPTPFRDAQERTDRETQTTRSTGSQFNGPSLPPLSERKLEREKLACFAALHLKKPVKTTVLLLLFM
ncbi:hypothetical protein MRX96_004715 [Rhipicephalus microplus]